MRMAAPDGLLMRRVLCALLLAALLLMLTGCDYIVVENSENIHTVGAADKPASDSHTAFDPFD